MTTPQSRHNARRRAEKLAAGECVEIGCPRAVEPGRRRCREHLDAASSVGGKLSGKVDSRPCHRAFKAERSWAAFLRQAKTAKARSKRTDVGFFASAKYPDGTPAAAVAAWNEFGTETIPERPFIRNAISGADRDLLPILKDGVDPKKMEVDARTAGLLGEAMKARIQNSRSRRCGDPPNAPSNRPWRSDPDVARKGHR